MYFAGGSQLVTDWENYRDNIECSELKARDDNAVCDLSYIGKFTDGGYTSCNGTHLDDGELWDFTTKYKYMSMLSNVRNYDNKCLVSYNASKMGRCLELGCDWGHCFDVLENFFVEVFGIEPMKLVVEAGRNVGRNIKLGVMERTGYSKENFDVVISRHVLEHGISPVVTLSEIYSITKVGGYSLHTIPCKLSGVIDEKSIIHSSMRNAEGWNLEFEQVGFTLQSYYYSWNHNQEEYNIIARKL